MGLLTAASAPANVKVGWKPFAGSQTAILQSSTRECLYEGNRGPGKTTTQGVRFAINCGRGWGESWRGIVLRREYRHLEDIAAKLQRTFRGMKNEPTFNRSLSSYKFVWPTGEELLLRTAKTEEDYWKYHGHEYPFVLWEELTEYADDTLYQLFRSINRSPIPDMPRCYLSTANPFGRGHGWVKNYFRCDLGPAPEGILIRETNDKGAITERARYTGHISENLYIYENDPEYIAFLKGIKDPNRRKAWWNGDWNISIGGFFDGYWDSDLIIKPFTPPMDWRRWRAIDWGSARPYSIGWYTVNPENGCIIRFRELYGYGGKANLGTYETAAEVADRIVKIEAPEKKRGIEYRNNPADDAMWNDQGHEIGLIDSFNSRKVYWTRASKMKRGRIGGWDTMKNSFGESLFKVTEDCEHWIRTVPGIMADDKDPEDIDTDSEDHAADETRYSINFYRRKDEAPKADSKKAPPKPGTFDHLTSNQQIISDPLLATL